ncbi:MAG: hypothetical protein AAF560_10185, partial [Acidobacteriota bacterium]
VDLVRRAHASDVPIHVAAPPDGHRWLVKERSRRRGLLGRWLGSQSARSEANPVRPAQAAVEPRREQREANATELDGRRPDGLSDTDELRDFFEGRVLAKPSAHTSVWEIYRLSRHNCTNTIQCSGFGFDFYRSDLLQRGAELRAGLFGSQGYASLTLPKVFGSSWVGTASLFRNFSPWDNSVPGRGLERLPYREQRTRLQVSMARPLSARLRLRFTWAGQSIEVQPDASAQEPGFVLPPSFDEHIGQLSLDIQQRELWARVALRMQHREQTGLWGLDGSERVTRRPGRLAVTAGYSTSLAGRRSLGLRAVAQKSWHLDQFSDNFSGFDGIRAPGFQPRRYDRGLGASVTFSHNIGRRVPISWRLEGALLRHERYGDRDQLGVEAEIFLDAWLKTDIFLRVGYGLVSSQQGEAGDLRSRLVLSRRF